MTLDIRYMSAVARMGTYLCGKSGSKGFNFLVTLIGAYALFQSLVNRLTSSPY